MLQQWNTVLACLDQPAFIRDASGIRLVNAAAARFGLQVGSDGIPAELPPVEQGPCSCSCRIGEQYWQVQVRDAQALQLVMLQPLETKAIEVASAAARELRDPLQQISVATSKLWPYLEEQEDERIQQGTASITRGLHRLLRVVNNLTDLELQTDLPLLMKKRTLCNGFLADFAEQVQPLVESTGRRMVLECPDRRFYALMDARMVERALLNLLLNAIQHTPEGGCITLRGSAQSKQCCFVVENEGDVKILSSFFYTAAFPQGGEACIMGWNPNFFMDVGAYAVCFEDLKRQPDRHVHRGARRKRRFHGHVHGHL